MALKKRDLKRFKELLIQNRAELVKKARRTLSEEMTLDTDDLPDEMDLATSEYNQSLIFRLRGREKQLLEKIDRALEKIDNGVFGICENCEEDIEPKRLDARPVTTLCFRCKDEQEKHERSYG
ncbi:MAG: TraR/DksA C4-type zinc finger protein [Deltaproteobacteria bacterium]|nr:TraR/DksA C4-type zinc finger protein [Deltaproteobacteria bacterium]